MVAAAVFDLLIADERIAEEYRALLALAVPEMGQIREKWTGLRWIEFLLTLPEWKGAAWDLYRLKKISVPCVSKFWIGCLKSSVAGGVKLLFERENELAECDRQEVLRWVFSSLPNFPPETVLSLPISFLAAHLFNLPQAALAGVKASSIYALLLEEAVQKKHPLPDPLAVEAFSQYEPGAPLPRRR